MRRHKKQCEAWILGYKIDDTYIYMTNEKKCFVIVHMKKKNRIKRTLAKRNKKLVKRFSSKGGRSPETSQTNRRARSSTEVIDLVRERLSAIFGRAAEADGRKKRSTDTATLELIK
jgi:hypothetical protein